MWLTLIMIRGVFALHCEAGTFRAFALAEVKKNLAAMTRRKELFTPIGDVIQQVLGKYRPTAGPGLLALWEIWPSVVGPDIGANAKPAAFKGALLLVHVSNSTWLHHLHCIQTELLAQLNDALGGTAHVGAIKFKIGPF